MIEIERKFLLNYLPGKVSSSTGVPLSQTYLWVGDGREARLRRFGKRYFLTIKDPVNTGATEGSGDAAGLKRRETEIALSKKQFDELWEAASDLRIEKTRHRVSFRDQPMEIDVFDGKLSGLQIAEAEFPDEESAAAFDPPPWCGQEITSDPLFRNSSLAAMTEEDVREKLAALIATPERSIGSIPVIYLNGEPKFVLITTTGSGRWIFPKGSPEAQMEDPDVAKMEAFEEAGVEGDLFQKPMTLYYWKGYQCSEITYYPLRVEKLHMSWDESSHRERKVCNLEEALELLDEPSFRHTLAEFSRKL